MSRATDQRPAADCEPRGGAVSVRDRLAQAEPKAARQFQFRLIHLFVLTTLTAVAAAAVAGMGPGTLPMSIGLIGAWLNASGAFRVAQRGPSQLVILSIAWVTFIVSMGLPSVVVFGPVTGWNAAWFVLTVPYRAVVQGELHQPMVLWYLLIDVANVLAALLPLIVWRLRRGGGQWLVAALCFAAIAPWSVGCDTPMLVGYYVWCSSFLLMLVALPINWRTLVAMVAATTVFAGAALWSEGAFYW